MCSRSPTAAALGGRWTAPCAPRSPRTPQARPARASRALAAARARRLPSRPPAVPRLVRRPPSWRQETRQSLSMQYRDCRRAQHARAARALLRGRHVAIVDELVDGLLDVDAGADHARLLQREPRFKDRVALRRADLVVGELGALLELLVDNRAIQAGDADEYLLQLIVIGERIFARLLVARDHAPHDVRVILGELLAHVEDAPGIGITVAVEQPRAVG